MVKVTKDAITIRSDAFPLLPLVRHSKNTRLPSTIVCDKIRYVYKKWKYKDKELGEMDFFNHEIEFYRRKSIVFAIRLNDDPKTKRFKNVTEALKYAEVTNFY